MGEAVKIHCQLQLLQAQLHQGLFTQNAFVSLSRLKFSPCRLLAMRNF